MILRSIVAFACLLTGLAIGQRMFNPPAFEAPPRLALATPDAIRHLLASETLASLPGPQEAAVLAQADIEKPPAPITASARPDPAPTPEMAEVALPDWRLKVTASSPSSDATAASPWSDVTAASPSSDVYVAMTRDLQIELRRLGCYGGAVDGRWSPDFAASVGQFTSAVNGSLPADGPDIALLSLARSHQPGVCIPSGSGATVIADTNPPGTFGDPAGFGEPIPGRMSLGAVPSPVREAVTARLPARRSTSEVERLFQHPLGQ